MKKSTVIGYLIVLFPAACIFMPTKEVMVFYMIMAVVTFPFWLIAIYRAVVSVGLTVVDEIIGWIFDNGKKAVVMFLVLAFAVLFVVAKQ